MHGGYKPHCTGAAYLPRERARRPRSLALARAPVIWRRNEVIGVRDLGSSDRLCRGACQLGDSDSLGSSADGLIAHVERI